MLFFTIGQFKFDGRDIPQTGVEPFGIVDLIDELAQIGRSLLNSLIVLEVDLLLSTPPSLTLMSLGGIFGYCNRLDPGSPPVTCGMAAVGVADYAAIGDNV